MTRYDDMYVNKYTKDMNRRDKEAVLELLWRAKRL